MASLSVGLPAMCHYPCMLESEITGYPAWPGFPVEYKMASGMDLLPCILNCIYHTASRFLGLPFNIQ